MASRKTTPSDVRRAAASANMAAKASSRNSSTAKSDAVGAKSAAKRALEATRKLNRGK